MDGSKRGELRVVDTNVIATANLWDEDVADGCPHACSRALIAIKRSGRLAVDAGGEILREYRNNGRASSDPGVGEEFVKWVHDVLGDRVEMVALNQAAHGYEEFPNDPDLASFDPSDRKFIAVAHAHAEKPPVLQATDSKWWGFKEAFQRNGITIEFLCPAEIEATYKRKVGGR